MKIEVKIISYILAFMLMLVFFIEILGGIAMKTVLNREYMLSKLEETNYYQKIQSNFLNQVEDYVEQSGLEEFNIESIFTVKQVKTDVNNLITRHI